MWILRADFRFDVIHQAGQLTQKGDPVIRERIFDLVIDCELRVAKHARLPEFGNFGMQQFGVTFFFCQGHRQITCRQQPGNFAAGVQNTFALDFGRMRGQHRRDQRFVKK